MRRADKQRPSPSATSALSACQVIVLGSHGANTVTAALVLDATKQQLEKLRGELGALRFDNGKFSTAAQLFNQMMTAAEFPEFLTLSAYNDID